MSKKKTKHLNKEKAKKEKIVYVDDGSTIVDMSGTINAPKKPKNQPKDPNHSTHIHKLYLVLSPILTQMLR